MVKALSQLQLELQEVLVCVCVCACVRACVSRATIISVGRKACAAGPLGHTTCEEYYK